MGSDGVFDTGPDMSSTQYVILAENQRKKKALSETKARYVALLSENRSLLEEKEAMERETYEVTEYLRKEIVSKSEAVARLCGELEEARHDAERTLATAREEEKARLAERDSHWKAQLDDAKANVERHARELEGLSEFRKRQAEVEGELTTLREENQGLRAQQDAALTQLERKFTEQATRTKKEYEARLAALKKSSEEDIDERLDASVKRILQQNRRMAEELRLHVTETDELQRARDSLLEEKKRLAREVDIKGEMEAQFAKRGSRQAKEISAANAKIRALERSLGQLTREFAREREALASKRKAEAANTQTELDDLRRLVSLKSRELKKIRRIANEVVRQRSDVERFLVDSLDAVRREITAERMGGVIPSTAGAPGTLPAIRSSTAGGGTERRDRSASPHSHTAALATSHVDIAELSWEDREKVLRLLFSKANKASSHEPYSASLPPHSFPVLPMGASPGTANIVPTSVATANKYTPLGSASSGMHPDLA